MPKRENPFVNMLTAIQRKYLLSSSSDRDILCCSLTVTVIINSYMLDIFAVLLGSAEEGCPGCTFQSATVVFLAATMENSRCS